MMRKFQSAALAGALIVAVSPAFAAQMMDMPVIGQVDIDPLNVMSPAPAPAAAPMKKMHHHKMMHHKMHKKMMKKKM